MRRDPAERKALRRLKTQQKESHNRAETKLEEKIIALVKALARQAAEADVRLERERENGRVQ